MSLQSRRHVHCFGSELLSDWLIAVCHSNLGDTFIALEVRSALFASESLLQYRKVCVLLGHFCLWVLRIGMFGNSFIFRPPLLFCLFCDSLVLSDCLLLHLSVDHQVAAAAYRLLLHLFSDSTPPPPPPPRRLAVF